MDFAYGDKVIIMSNCSSKGEIGTVLHKVDYYCSDYFAITVQLENGGKRSYNPLSLKKIKDESKESEEINMTGFDKVAIVNLLEDFSKKDYAFALYNSEWILIEQGQFEVKPNSLVVVNAGGKDKRKLGIVKEIMSLETYGKGVNAQVVGVVNTDAYNARVEEENKAKEVAKKKAAIEKELEEEISKRKTVEFYEEMANKYSDNPRLAELVAELKGLGA